jgi:hypothetical protein
MTGKNKLSGAAYRKKSREKREKLTNVIMKSAKINNYFKKTDLAGIIAYFRF